MADDNLMNQNDIEELLSSSKEAAIPRQNLESPTDNGVGDDSNAQAGDSKNQTEGGDGEATNETSASAATGKKPLGQEEMENLLHPEGHRDQAGSEAPGRDRGPVGESSVHQSAVPQQDTVAREDIDYLLRKAEQAIQSIDAESEKELPTGIAAFRFEELAGAAANTDNATLDLLNDVELDLKIELGRTNMYLEEVLKLRRGSVVPLDKLAGDPVDIFVNGRLIARGEVLVLNDNFCVRVGELIAGTSSCNRFVLSAAEDAQPKHPCLY